MQNMWPKPSRIENASSSNAEDGHNHSPAQASEHQQRADPGRHDIVPAVDEPADPHRREYRHQRKAAGNQADPEHRQIELDGAVGGRDARQRDHGIDRHGVRHQRHEQADVQVVPGGRAAGPCAAEFSDIMRLELRSIGCARAEPVL